MRHAPAATTGARTSYKTVAGVTYGTAVSRDKAALPAEMQAARYCENWEARCEAAARTWMRPHAQDNLMWVGRWPRREPGATRLYTPSSFGCRQHWRLRHGIQPQPALPTALRARARTAQPV